MALTGCKSKLVYLPLPHDEQIQRQPDISLAKKILDGWTPLVKLETGLEYTINYFDHLLKS